MSHDDPNTLELGLPVDLLSHTGNLGFLPILLSPFPPTSPPEDKSIQVSIFGPSSVGLGYSNSTLGSLFHFSETVFHIGKWGSY